MTDHKEKTMPPIKSYSIAVGGFPAHVYHGRTPSQARMAAFRAYQNYNDRCTFKEFLLISSLTRIENPPPVGERVLICGKPADLISLSTRGDPLFMWADGDVVMRAHYSELIRSPASAAVA